jgi:hypothetical protein
LKKRDSPTISFKETVESPTRTIKKNKQKKEKEKENKGHLFFNLRATFSLIRLTATGFLQLSHNSEGELCTGIASRASHRSVLKLQPQELRN